MSLTSQVGIDFGDSASRIAITRRGGVDIVCNEASNRATPTMVSFGPRERLLGESAAGQAVMNARNTVSELKRLIGRQFADPDTQAELKRQMFKAKPLPDGTVGVEVQYKGSAHTFSFEQLTGMYLGHLKRLVERETSARCREVVITCPGWWVDAQRRALIAAAEIAGLHCLRLIHELTAVALQYGLFRLDLDPEKPTHVMFIDMGASQLSVAVVAFTKSRMRVLATAYDPHLGGRDFDDLLVKHFAAEFAQKYKIDVTQNPRAMLRLSAACEKLKKTLSANSQAHLNVESIMNDIDVRGEMRRDQFEQMIEPLLDRVGKPIRQALADAGLAAADLHAAEAIGNGIRLPPVQRRMEAELKRELGKTQNMSESVVKGAALQAAMASTGARVREYTVQDAYPYAMDMLWAAPVGSAPQPDDRMELIKVRHAFPLQSTITFHQQQPFEIEVRYSNPAALPTAGDPNREAAAQIGKWTVDVHPPLEKKHDVRVKCALPISGLFTVEGAQLVESVEVTVEVPATPAAASPAANAAAPAAEKKAETAEPMATDPPTSPMQNSSEAASSSSNGSSSGGAGSNAGGGSENTPAPAQKKTKTVTQQKLTSLAVKAHLAHVLPPETLKAYVELEARMADDDRLFIETAEKRNQLEEYVLNMKSKLSGPLQPYITAENRTLLLQQLDQTELWLMEEATDDTTKHQFAEKLAPLEKLGEPAVQRMRDYTVTLPDAFALLRDRLQALRRLLNSREPKHDHIDRPEREKVLEEADAVERWAAEREAALQSGSRTEPPPLAPYELQSRADKVEAQGRALMAKPKPEPPKPPEPPKAEPEKPAAAAAAKPEEAAEKAKKEAEKAKETAADGPPPPPPPTADGGQQEAANEKEKKAKTEADGDKKPMDVD